MNLGSILSAGILLVIVIGMYMAVSYKHEKSGLGKGCDGNCGSCGLRSSKCTSENKDTE